MRDITLTSLAGSYILVLIFIVFAAWKKLGLARDTLFSSIRGIIQLTLVGFAIVWIFKIENTWVLIGMLFVMGTIATTVSAKRAQFFKNIWLLIALAIYSSIYLTLGFLFLTGAIDWTGQFVIPVGGILIGQTMNNCSLFLERLLSDAKAHRLEIESNLSLGATPSEAIAKLIRQALIAESIPIVDNLKTLGLIFIPGMMGGLIIAGTDPMIAVKYQLIIIFMLVFAYGWSSLVLALLSPFFLFNKNYQLKI